MKTKGSQSEQPRVSLYYLPHKAKKARRVTKTFESHRFGPGYVSIQGADGNYFSAIVPESSLRLTEEACHV